MDRSVFYIYWVDSYSGYEFILPLCNVFLEITLSEFEKCLIPHHGVLYNRSSLHIQRCAAEGLCS